MAESRQVLENPTSLVSMCMEFGLEAVLTELSLKPRKELQEPLFVLSSFATAEFLQLIGIGAGFTSLDMQGFALAQINKKLDQIQDKINTMLDTPAKAALTYLERGVESVKAKNNSLAFDEFKRVIDYSIQGRNYKKGDLATVVDLSLYSIFADLMINTYDSKKDFFAPYELLEREKKTAIKNKIKKHLDTLLEAQNKKKSSLFSLPSTKREKKEANQNLVDSVLKKSLQYVCPPGSPVPIKFIPDGKDDTALVNLDGKPGRVDASTVYIYKEGSNVVIRHYNNNVKQEASIDCGHREELVVKANHSGLTIDNSTKEIKSTDFNKLIDASGAGDKVAVSLLLQHPGVQVNERIEDGSTPLIVAAREGHLDVASQLLTAGADITAVNRWGTTPLHFAAMYGHLEVASRLLTAGANIRAVNNGKGTPLHSAAWNGHLEMARLLVRAGANAEAGDQHGYTPAQRAKKEGHKDVFNYLANV